MRSYETVMEEKIQAAYGEENFVITERKAYDICQFFLTAGATKQMLHLFCRFENNKEPYFKSFPIKDEKLHIKSFGISKRGALYLLYGLDKNYDIDKVSLQFGEGENVDEYVVEPSSMAILMTFYVPEDLAFNEKAFHVYQSDGKELKNMLVNEY